MASVQVVLDAKNIDIIPGMGLSLADVLKLILNYWRPDKPAYQQIKAALAAAVQANNAADICKILTGGDFADAVLQALTHILIEKLKTITNALPGCTIDCSGGGPSAANVAKTVLEISVKSFDGDGVSFGTLIAEVVTNVVCCAVQLGVDFAIKKIGTGRILGKLRERCTSLISKGSGAAASAISAASGTAGYGAPAAPAVQVNAAAETVGTSLTTTTRAQADAVAIEVKRLEDALAVKVSGMKAELSNLDNTYGPEFQRLLKDAQARGDTARVKQLQEGLQYIAGEQAKYRASIAQFSAPYEAEIARLRGHVVQIQASGGLTGGVNWKPLQVAAGTAAVGVGLVVFSPVVIAAGAIALVAGLFRLRRTVS